MIRISTKGRYATRIMVYLALCPVGRPARKQEIANAEGISADYVEQILMKLKAAGLVTSRRGAKGGFTIARPPEGMTVVEVLEATEGAIALAPCLDSHCARITQCVVSAVWEKGTQTLKSLFAETSIGELAKEVLEHQRAASLSFEI